MKVILLKDVKALGKEDDIVEVSPGYANNMLLKKGLALEATPENLNSVKTKKKAQAAREQRELDEAKKIAKEMEGKEFTLKVKSGEGSKLYGAVTAIDIAKVIATEGYKVDKRSISLNTNIKSLGRFEATVKLHTQVSATIAINVVSL